MSRAGARGLGLWSVGGLLLGLLILAASAAQADLWLEGRVVGVADGDTLTLLESAGRAGRPVMHRVRLAGIDAPERGQAFGRQAKRSLAELVYGKQVRVEIRDRDQYGRLVGRVFVGALDVNREQLRRGLAWVYRHYNADPDDLAAEAEARQARRGLWVEAHPVPPWEFRASRRQVSRAPAPGWRDQKTSLTAAMPNQRNWDGSEERSRPG